MNSTPSAIATLYEKNFGSIFSVLTREFPSLSIGEIEDAVQESFSKALEKWTGINLPRNPKGWLYRVARNKLVNDLRRAHLPFPVDSGQPAAGLDEPTLLQDDNLRMLFLCSHPRLAPRTQLILALRYVASLRIESIARLLGITIDGIDKQLARAREKITKDQLRFTEPGLDAAKQRLSIAHRVIYLIFNEGYKTSSGSEVIREQLCEEALALNHALMNSRICSTETKALQALMLFHASRLPARFSPEGELMSLEEQDRRLWDQRLIFLGTQLLREAEDPTPSTYHLEAAVGFLHSKAKSFLETDWNGIKSLYRLLMTQQPNPFVQLNYAIALHYNGETLSALSMLQELRSNRYLNGYAPLNAALGKLYAESGRHSEAISAYTTALAQTSSPAEKRFFSRQIARLKSDQRRNSPSDGHYID